MVFNSAIFAAFFCLVYALFLALPGRFKRYFLVVASFAFYAVASYKACVVLAVVSLVCFYGGRLIHAAADKPRRQYYYLLGCIVFLIALLSYFKYFPVVLGYLQQFVVGLKAGHTNLAWLFFPVGVSYFVLQGIGYLVDVYWGKTREDDLVDFLLFMAFFPKVMMGPIERGDKLLPQIKQLAGFRFDYDRFREAVFLFGWGLFKKLVIADRLALYVNEVYQEPGSHFGISIITAIIFFAFQLYSDFSGYTDMALAVGKLLGLDLMQNFDRPFYATSVPGFWHRWHISLSSWIGDYVFLPLRMKLRRFGKPGLVVAIFTAFIIVGAWHGTGWTFIILGAVHGLYVTVSSLTMPARDAYWKRRNQLGKWWLTYARRFVTFWLLALSMVFFRAASVADAFTMLKHLPVITNFNLGLTYAFGTRELLVAIAMVLVMEIAETFFRAGPSPFSQLFTRPLWQRWPAYVALLLAIFCFGVFFGPQRFLYFAF